MKIAILGAGNMGSAIACGLVRSGKFQAEEIVCTARTETTLERLRTQCPGVRTTTDNAAAVRDAAVVMLAVKPWLTEALIREIRREIDPDRQSVVSVAAGVSLAQLAEWMTADSAVRPALFRVIPNTAIAVRQSMTVFSVKRFLLFLDCFLPVRRQKSYKYNHSLAVRVFWHRKVQTKCLSKILVSILVLQIH